MRFQPNARVLNIAGLLLLLFASGLAFFFWHKFSTTQTENTRLASEEQGLELEKSMIERGLDSLTISYQNARLENEELRGKAASSAEQIAQKDATIRKIKTQGRQNLNALRKQVEELRRVKIEYETVITTVRAENDQLKKMNEQLNGENAQLRNENSSLNGQMQQLAKQLEEQIRKTQSARFKATSFRVEVSRKTDKLTARAKRARELAVSFDLVDVPEAYREIQKLYLAITDDKGRPIASQNPTKTTVQAPTGPVAVIAQQVKQVVLNETQRLSFSYKFDERLESGNYVVAIYCEAGLLGATCFRLF